MKAGRIELCTFSAAILVVAFQLFVPPVVGMANNGDFHKVLAGFSLSGDVRDEYKFVSGTLHFGPEHYLKPTYGSSEQLLAFLSIGVNSLFLRDGSYDLRAMGFVHAAPFLMSLWLALPLLRGLSPVRRAICSVVILLVFGDVLYVSQLNSFYMDTAVLVFLLLSVVFICRVLEWGRRGDAIGMLISLLLMAVSKAQHAPLGLAAAVLLSIHPALLLPGFSKAARVAVIGVLVAASIYTQQSTHWFYKATPLFSEIFYGVLPRAADPSAELKMLGLDESYRQYIGMHAYVANSPVNDDRFVKEFLTRTSYGRLGLFFLRKPGRALDLLVAGMTEAGRQRPLMGSYDRSAGRPEWAESRAFSSWSGAKARAFEGHGAVYLGYAVGLSIAFLTAVGIRRRTLPCGSLAAGLTLIAMLWAALLISILGDALDPIRHSLVFTALSDLTLVSLALLALSRSSWEQLTKSALSPGRAAAAQPATPKPESENFTATLTGSSDIRAAPTCQLHRARFHTNVRYCDCPA